MSVSLYAFGTAKIEIGRYGMTLQKAKEAFSAKLEEHSLPYEIKEEDGEVCFYLYKPKHPILKFNSEKWAGLLSDIANIADLHGDAPDTYSLESKEVPDGEYIKTGEYND